MQIAKQIGIGSSSLTNLQEVNCHTVHFRPEKSVYDEYDIVYDKVVRLITA